MAESVAWKPKTGSFCSFTETLSRTGGWGLLLSTTMAEPMEVEKGHVPMSEFPIGYRLVISTR